MNDNSFDDPEVARHWIQSIESDGARIRETDIYPLLREWISSQSVTAVLEIGCGQGASSTAIPPEVNYIGIDPSAFLLTRANELNIRPNLQFRSGNAYALPFTDQTFDAIYSITVWHLLKDIEKAGSELARVLKTNGNFLIITANPEAYGLWDKIFTESKRDGNRLEGTIIEAGKVVAKDVLYLHTLDELIQTFQNVGLTTLKTDTFRLDPESGLNRFIAISGKR
jgi:ubiquinone/menaquinone biosynthesis C-methylase UbiE